MDSQRGDIDAGGMQGAVVASEEIGLLKFSNRIERAIRKCKKNSSAIIIYE